MFTSFAHKRACAAKQRERRERIERLPPSYHDVLSDSDKNILEYSVAQIVEQVQRGALSPNAVLAAYTKKAVKAHAQTNCLTEILLPEAEDWATTCDKEGPLAGMPVSLKDLVTVAGRDTCFGYSTGVGHPASADAPIVRLLRDAGAIPFVKTNVPTTLLSFECANDVFGVTTNLHNARYSPGGSSGGEAALLAYGGSRIGIGSDVAGSVRCPSHYSGTYAVKASSFRVPMTGDGSSMPGAEGIPAVHSPMARTLEDLETFWRAMISMRPWEYDHTCVPIPWRETDLSETNKPRWGVMWDDGVVYPSPACQRALKDVVSALEANGHEVVTIDPPSPAEGLKIASQILLADACKSVSGPLRMGETNDPGMVEAFRMFRVPGGLRRLYAWYIRRVRRDALYADLVADWDEKKISEYLALVVRREAYRAQWFSMMREQRLDFVLTVPNALPAVPHGGMRDGFKSCGYTFLWNLLDYTAGVLPVTRVDRVQDALGPLKTRNAIEAGVYKMYDADAMHGLPIGVQVVGKHLEEEKVLEGMKIVERLLKSEGKGYNLFRAGD